MGGDNFYLIGKKDSWSKMTRIELLEKLDKKEIKIVTPKESDCINNLQAIGIGSNNANIINLPTDNIGKEIFELEPNILISGNQNLRFSLLFDKNYLEVIDLNSFIDESLKKHFIDHSKNVFVINKSIYNKLSKPTLTSLIIQAKQNFHENLSNQYKLDTLIKSLVSSMNNMSNNKKELNYIVKSILYKTYRFGSPV